MNYTNTVRKSKREGLFYTADTLILYHFGKGKREDKLSSSFCK